MDAQDAELYPGPGITIDGSRYPLPENFSFREAQWVKRLTGLRMGDFMEALSRGDADFTLAYAIVAMARNTELTAQQVEKIMLDKAPENVTIDFRTAEEQKAQAESLPVPPGEAAANAEQSHPSGSTSSTNEILEPTGAQV